MIWPFITGSGQALIILPRPPSQPHTDWKCSSSCLSQTLLSPTPTLCSQPSLPSQGNAGAQKQQGLSIPHQLQREIHKSKGPERTKLSHQSIMEPDLKITPGQRPASCESLPGQNSHRGPQPAAGKNMPVASWLLRARLGGCGCLRGGWFHTSCCGVERTQPQCEHCGSRRKETRKWP